MPDVEISATDKKLKTLEEEIKRIREPLENKIRTMLGLSPRESRKIYQDLYMRARLLELMVERKETGFDNVWKMVKYCYANGVQHTLEMVEQGVAVWSEEE